MLVILLSDEFDRKFKELPLNVRKKSLKKVELFRNNPFHPSLNTEKLNPKQQGIWSFRIDESYRILFKFMEHNRVLFLTAAHHNRVYRYFDFL